ncbi:MAG TPA: M23 family metallopeptidase [Methylomirabilota bacterium]|nr:M23 family metallopeptidase [Methylomirabilota bacterium]
MRTRKQVLLSLLALAAWVPAITLAADGAVADPGGIVRWSAAGTEACFLHGDAYPPLGDTCYYPFDLDTPAGSVEVGRRRHGEVELATVRVGDYPYPVQRLQVERSKVTLSEEDLERVRREQAMVGALWDRAMAEARFSLPLSDPLTEMPEPRSFGARRVFNDQPRSPHSGIDLPAETGTPVFAVADGTVALVGDLFFSGESVFVDHGGGLVSMYFHLSEVDVAEGAEVERCQHLGAVGSTGRSTGPHLHLGFRWYGARVDPILLLGKQVMPAIGE